ncbi:putative orfan [Tupanvirus soda lake]|uniref:Orfan n=2 Tax=Tupanvirus TaxID=2094720 RepID=A0AC62ADC7_9VIRU|nr:putative orfan [Tupanvirus soda lake]QKU35769.1 putative orfan [Tupanvirus soda lake]
MEKNPENNILVESNPTNSTDSWENYFTTKSKGVKLYETNVPLVVYGQVHDCKLTLRVSELNYCDCYAWELFTNEIVVVDGHPFDKLDDEEIEKSADGKTISVVGINAKNKLMDSLYELIMMDNDKLSKNSGSIDPSYYRSHMVKILTELWD